MSFRKALWLSIFWVALSGLFAAGVLVFKGPDPASQWLTAYVVEKSLSVDNLLVFALLFQYFQVPNAQQSRYLYWGIWGAALMRAAFIGVGVGLIQCCHFLIYLCGAFLVFTAAKMLFSDGDDEVHFDQSWVYRLLSGKVSMFWLVVAVLEVTDIAFATDSVPAALAISQDFFIVFTSNMMAVLGLRALYFLLAACMDRLQYLKHGVSAVLCLIGLKMLAPVMTAMAGLNTAMWLAAVGVLLGGSVVASLLKPQVSAE